MTDPQPDIKMTEERARKSIEFFTGSSLNKNLDSMAEYFIALGYLQALEHERQAAKGLVEALEKIYAGIVEPPPFRVAEKALAAYKDHIEKENKEK